MISNEALPIKEDKSTEIPNTIETVPAQTDELVTITTTSETTSTETTTEPQQEHPNVLVTATTTTAQQDIEKAEQLTGDDKMNTKTTINRMFTLQFQQKTKYIRDMITQQRVRKINKDNSQLITIIFLSIMAICCSIASLSTNNWSCDETNKFGIWNTCYWNDKMLNNTDEAIINPNETMSKIKMNGIMCANQELHGIKIEMAEQTRIDQVTASQWLMICGTLFYFFSIITASLTYKFKQGTNMNLVRNTLVLSLFIQIIAFCMLLAGFFLFISTDHYSVSVTLLFVYFGLGIFATNIINFITIEYKCYKYRQMSI